MPSMTLFSHLFTLCSMNALGPKRVRPFLPSQSFHSAIAAEIKERQSKNHTHSVQVLENKGG